MLGMARVAFGATVQSGFYVKENGHFPIVFLKLKFPSPWTTEDHLTPKFTYP